MSIQQFLWRLALLIGLLQWTFGCGAPFKHIGDPAWFTALEENHSAAKEYQEDLEDAGNNVLLSRSGGSTLYPQRTNQSGVSYSFQNVNLEDLCETQESSRRSISVGQFEQEFDDSLVDVHNAGRLVRTYILEQLAYCLNWSRYRTSPPRRLDDIVKIEGSVLFVKTSRQLEDSDEFEFGAKIRIDLHVIADRHTPFQQTYSRTSTQRAKTAASRLLLQSNAANRVFDTVMHDIFTDPRFELTLCELMLRDRPQDPIVDRVPFELVRLDPEDQKALLRTDIRLAEKTPSAARPKRRTSEATEIFFDVEDEIATGLALHTADTLREKNFKNLDQLIPQNLPRDFPVLRPVRGAKLGRILVIGPQAVKSEPGSVDE